MVGARRMTAEFRSTVRRRWSPSVCLVLPGGLVPPHAAGCRRSRSATAALPETRTVQPLAQACTLTRIVRGTVPAAASGDRDHQTRSVAGQRAAPSTRGSRGVTWRRRTDGTSRRSRTECAGRVGRALGGRQRVVLHLHQEPCVPRRPGRARPVSGCRAERAERGPPRGRSADRQPNQQDPDRPPDLEGQGEEPEDRRDPEAGVPEPPAEGAEEVREAEGPDQVHEVRGRGALPTRVRPYADAARGSRSSSTGRAACSGPLRSAAPSC